MRIAELLTEMEASNTARVLELTGSGSARWDDAWEVHLALFPLVQRVLNPPFINPHLPKMYRIFREFLPYLHRDEVAPLVRLEISEYAKRPKLAALPQPPRGKPPVSFNSIETAIREGRRETVAALLSAFLEQNGAPEFARRMLLLGSGYMEQTLGHSVSCTSFILLEMLERPDQDTWEAVATLADYFCKGQFHTTPAVSRSAHLPSQESLNGHLLRATSGSGIVNLHHTITRYAIERVRHLLDEEEYAHLVNGWIQFLGSKTVETAMVIPSPEMAPDYDTFYGVFSKRNEAQVLAGIVGMTASSKGRRQMGRYLIRGVCEQYQGDYNPHFLTGLGATLWVVDQYWEQAPIVANALRQYVNFLFN